MLGKEPKVAIVTGTSVSRLFLVLVLDIPDENHQEERFPSFVLSQTLTRQSGLGTAIARGLLEEGWIVAGFDIQESSQHELGKEYGDSFAYYNADVSDYDSQAVAFSKVFEKHGRLDALCASAGIIDRSSIYISSHRGKTE
jgi:hypothetical protein